jgi:hypothetical protein
MKMRACVIMANLTCFAAAAAVQARNPETGATLRTVSVANGTYRLAPAALGNYTLSVAMPGFTYLPFTQSGVAVSGAAPTDDRYQRRSGHLRQAMEDHLRRKQHGRTAPGGQKESPQAEACATRMAISPGPSARIQSIP